MEHCAVEQTGKETGQVKDLGCFRGNCFCASNSKTI